MPQPKKRYVVVGIGNPDRGDDAVGREVARMLKRTLPLDVEVVEHNGETTSLLSCLQDADLAILIDACTCMTSAGTVLRFDARTGALPNAKFNVSTHGLGLAEAIELARSLDQLPTRCIVYAVVGEVFEPGAPLSAPVCAAIDEVGDRVRREIESMVTDGWEAKTNA